MYTKSFFCKAKEMIQYTCSKGLRVSSITRRLSEDNDTFSDYFYNINDSFSESLYGKIPFQTNICSRVVSGASSNSQITLFFKNFNPYYRFTEELWTFIKIKWCLSLIGSNRKNITKDKLEPFQDCWCLREILRCMCYCNMHCFHYFGAST